MTTKNPRIEISNIVTAFSPATIGTKVRTGFEDTFWNEVEAAIAKQDFSTGSTPGQAFMFLSPDAIFCVSAGVGRRTADEADYIARSHRGQVGLFLKREKAAPAENVAVIVYTKAAYLADPDVKRDAEELARAQASDKDFFLVGNNSAKTMTAEDIRTVAAEVVAYDNEWCVVAD